MVIAQKVATCIERASWIRKMFEEGELLRSQFGADKVYDFTLGNPDVEPPEAFNKAFLELAQKPVAGMHRYMNNAGYPETRDAVGAALTKASGLDVKGSQVVMTCGAGGALNVVLKTILNPGDEVIILTPFFVEYRFYIDNHGGVPVEVWTNPETFQLDVPKIGAAITAKTRAIIICTPNNPTGVIYPAESLKALGETVSAKEKEFGTQICVISDEPYARISYDGKHVPNIFPHVANSVIVTSHSKDLALPGERIGYLAANPRMKDSARFMEGAIFANRVLGFVNAPALMQRLVAGLQHESVDIAAYQAKRDLIYNELTGMGFEMVKPDGAFYFFPKSPMSNDVEFVKAAQKHRILLVPGAGFGAPGYFRIAYCVDKGMIERSFDAWRALAVELGLKG
ncbi:pyridoxal phosphate-dependent aminotransferase [Geomonas sp. Red32]|uniref:pyridoxal phosphate-dependent aminotransferase n=1 Tax=Geomonas sp. Red32 TaxID=2912856 RepID=UPI00202CC1E3|nr:pyridoxal phosphate-dependent aminotransferase [Geomonas sp. Red32]MCM0081856.1 pyridoxal phosphate-dependent aminotransferase [Geomonas sp. Red32]